MEEINMLVAGAYITVLECVIGRICVANHAQQLGISCYDFIERFGKPKHFELEDKDHFKIYFANKVFNYQFSEDACVTIVEENYEQGIRQKEDRRNLN